MPSMISPPGVPSLQRNSTGYAPCSRRRAQALVTVDIIGPWQSANYISADLGPSPPAIATLTGPAAIGAMVPSVFLIRQGKSGRGWESCEGLANAGEREDPADVVASLA